MRAGRVKRSRDPPPEYFYADERFFYLTRNGRVKYYKQTERGFFFLFFYLIFIAPTQNRNYFSPKLQSLMQDNKIFLRANGHKHTANGSIVLTFSAGVTASCTVAINVVGRRE